MEAGFFLAKGGIVLHQEKIKTITQLFRHRVKESESCPAYGQFFSGCERFFPVVWSLIAERVSAWQEAFQREGLVKGDRVAILYKNSVEWVCFDQAALGLGLIVVPLYTNDRPSNIAHILNDSESSLLFLEDEEEWYGLENYDTGSVKTVVSFAPTKRMTDYRVISLQTWLPKHKSSVVDVSTENDVATIVYTSGTTGRSKGVVLTHKNIVENVKASLQVVSANEQDRFLSFLPLSHMLERMAGYYLPMLTGSRVYFARSIADLNEDLQYVKPSVLISVPRVYERILKVLNSKLEKAPWIRQKMFQLAVNNGWRDIKKEKNEIKWNPTFFLSPVLKKTVAQKLQSVLGGNLRIAVCGGAKLSDDVSKIFLSLGVNIVQGYGLTEHSPVISVNPLEDNRPLSAGKILPNIEVRVRDGELLVKSPSVTQGYWKNPEATSDILKNGWLATGDLVEIKDDYLYITGRSKEIIVLSTGKKVSPGEIETAITLDNLFDQAILVGEDRPFLIAIVVPNESYINKNHTTSKEEREKLCERLNKRLMDFPGFAIIRNVVVCTEPWTVENGLMTPTLKVKRDKIINQFEDNINASYRETLNETKITD